MINFLYNTTIIIIVTFLSGILYNFVNNKTSKAIQKTFGWNFFILIASIGTIIHELSHLIVSLLFLHLPLKIELFRPIKGRIDGVLGCVEHSYKKTKFRIAGNFFIGCAPMISGSLIIMLLLKLINIDINNLSLSNIKCDFEFFIVMFLIISIAICMNMSKADMQNSIFGCISLMSLSFTIYMILKVFTSIDMEVIINYSNILTKYYVYVLIFGFIICCITYTIFNIIYVLRKILIK